MLTCQLQISIFQYLAPNRELLIGISYNIQRSLTDTWLPPQMLGGVKSVRYFRNLMFMALSAFAEGTVFRNIALNLNMQKKEISCYTM
jgi:hypothetical protein